jgi:hypothetical protein
MLQRQDHAPGIVAVQQGGAAPDPGSGDGQTIIAPQRMTRILAGQRRAAQIADKPADERRIAPTGPAQAEVPVDGCIAGKTLGRVDQMKRSLQF